LAVEGDNDILRYDPGMIYFDIPPPVDYCGYEALFALVGVLVGHALRLSSPLLCLGDYPFSLFVGILLDFSRLLAGADQFIVGLLGLTVAAVLNSRRRAGRDQTDTYHAMRLEHRSNDQIKVVYVFAPFPGLYKEIGYGLRWNWFEENVVFASLNYKPSLASAGVV